MRGPIIAAVCGALLCVPALARAQPQPPDAFDAGLRAYIQGDPASARALWQQAAEQGEAEAQFNLALLWEQGLGGDADPLQAAYWYHAAAREGFAPAQFNLGVLFYAGRGVPQNLEQAADWWTTAARAGLARAALNLGLLYLEGRGVRRNALRARYWIERAAEQRLSSALVRLIRLPPMPADANELADVPGIAWVRAQQPEHLTARLHTAASFDEALAFIEAHGLGPVAVVIRDRTDRWPVLGGIFETVAAGEQALTNLTPRLRAAGATLVPLASVQADLGAAE